MKRCITILIGLFWAGLMFAQLPSHYSQYMQNGLVLNPAYAGSHDALSATTVYKAQWLRFPGAPRTYTFGIHAPLRDKINNFGMLFIHDELGVSRENMLLACYAYAIPLGKNRLSLGIQGGFKTLRNDYSILGIVDQGDAHFSSDSPTFLVPKVGFGIWFKNPKYYFGASIPELVNYQSTAYKLYYGNGNFRRHYLLTAAYTFRLNVDINLEPSILLKYMPTVPAQLDLNVFINYRERFWLGLSYRTQDAVLGLIKIKVNEQFSFGYSYGWGITALQAWHDGTHEIMLSYDWKYRLKTPDPIRF